MNIKPLGDRLVVKALETGEIKKGGIIIPDTAKEKPQEGEVIATGPGKKTDDGKVIPMDVKVDDKIIFEKYAGREIKIDNKPYIIMNQDDVLGIVK